MEPTGAWAAGNAAFRAGKLDEALTQYTRFLDEDKNEDTSSRCTVLSNRAQVYLQTGKAARALRDANAALELDPTLAKALFRKVSALVKLGIVGEAEKVAKAAQDGDFSVEDKVKVPPPRQPRLLFWICGHGADTSWSCCKIMAVVQQASKQRSREGNTSKQRVRLDASETAGARLNPARDWLPPALQKGSIFVPPATGQIENILIMLHGLGDVPGNYAALARKMSLPGTLCIVLSAPMALPVPDMAGGMWYLPRSMMDNQEEAKLLERESYRPSCDSICLLLRKLHEKGPWPFSRLHLFGFSQGGSLALGVAMHFRDEDKLGGCVSVSGNLLLDYLAPVPSSHDSGGSGGTPVLITHGDLDSKVSRHDIEASITAIKSRGCPARCRRIPGKGHAMVGSEMEMRELMEFWAETLKAPPPPTAPGERIVEVHQ